MVPEPPSDLEAVAQQAEKEDVNQMSKPQRQLNEARDDRHRVEHRENLLGDTEGETTEREGGVVEQSQQRIGGIDDPVRAGLPLGRQSCRLRTPARDLSSVLAFDEVDQQRPQVQLVERAAGAPNLPSQIRRRRQPP